MNTQLRLIPFFAFLGKKVPRYIKPEFKVDQVGEDEYKIMPAPLIMKDGIDFEHLYFNFDQLLPEYKELYCNDLYLFSSKENGNYQLETRTYQMQKKRKNEVSR